MIDREEIWISFRNFVIANANITEEEILRGRYNHTLVVRSMSSLWFDPDITPDFNDLHWGSLPISRRESVRLNREWRDLLSRGEAHKYRTGFSKGCRYMEEKDGSYRINKRAMA